VKYDKVISGKFISRPNRFIAKVEIDGTEETVHVKNTGRCRELLVPDAKVYLSVSDNPARKTRCDLIAVEKVRGGKPLLINMDSQLPNGATAEWLNNCGLFSENAVIRREVTFGKSRFDFCIDDCGKKTFIEVKGVTLENEGVALFPDAPTERGARHLEELVKAKEEGYGAYVMFVIQMKGPKSFTPYTARDLQFTRNLVKAQSAGVKVMAYDTLVTAHEIILDSPIKVILPKEEEL
jgi:sugar fermentation stimulation protein A